MRYILCNKPAGGAFGACCRAAAGVVWPGGTFVPGSVFSGARLCAEVTASAGV